MRINFKKEFNWWVAAILFVVVFGISYLSYSLLTPKSSQDNNVPIQTEGTTETKEPGLWLENFETAHPDNECANKIVDQITYLKNEKLSDVYTFDKYKITNIQTTNLADLNVYSNKHANEFRTRIREGMAYDGINFAGHYSLVNVPMTGWGNNYYIIDRETGSAYIFPYKPYSLEFQQNSNLLIMDSKENIWNSLKETSDFSDNCREIYSWLWAPVYYDLKPIYFLWQNNELIQLGPKDVKPAGNAFWN
jgi:hypothetical protein